MQSRNRKLLENILSLSMLQVLNFSIPILLLPYLLNIVGKSYYGSYIVAYSMIQYVLLISAYGFGFTATKQISQNRNNNHIISIICNSVIIARFILAFISYFPLLLICYFCFGKVYSIMMFMGCGIVIGDILNPVWLFQGMEDMKYMTVVNFVCKVVIAFLFFIIIHEPSDYIYIIAIDSLAYFVSGIFSLYLSVKTFKFRLFIPSKRSIFFQLKDGWYVFITTIFQTLYRNSNVILMRFFVSDAIVGIYAGAEKIIKAAQSITSPISVAFFPNLANRFKDETLAANKRTILNLSKYMFFVFLFITICLFVSSSFINDIFLNGQEDGTTEIVKLMSPVVLFGGLNYLIGVSGLINLGKKKEFLRNVVVSSMFSIICLLGTVSNYGAFSGAISMLLSEVILFLLCIRTIIIIK